MNHQSVLHFLEIAFIKISPPVIPIEKISSTSCGFKFKFQLMNQKGANSETLNFTRFSSFRLEYKIVFLMSTCEYVCVRVHTVVTLLELVVLCRLKQV